MNRYSKGQWTLVAAGASLLLFGSLVLAMLPAAADDPGAGGGTTTSTSAGPTTTGPATSAQTPAVESPSAKTTTTTVPPTTTTLPAGPPVPGGIVPCASVPAGVPTTAGDTCAEMPCPTGRNCGVVVAAPTSSLGPGQYVYLHLYNFVPGDTGVTMYYCANPGGATTLAGIPTCAKTNTSSDSDASQEVGIYPPSTSTIVPQGTAIASMQAAEVATSSTPIAGFQYNGPGDNGTGAEPGFFCDGTADNPCAIVLTDSAITFGHPASSSANSVVIPVAFASSTAACSNASVVSTESEFGIELLMPAVARMSCANDPSKAVIPFETADDGLNAVTDLVGGAQQVAFTDDPEAPDQQAQLNQGGYALIPVALTANVVAFDAQILSVSQHQNYNLGQMDLTPTMSAGLLTQAVNDQGSAGTGDSVACSGPSEVPPTAPGQTVDTTSGPCLTGAPCFGTTTAPIATCSLFLQLNYINGFKQFGSPFQAIQRSDNAGATDQLFNWLCNAPNVPLDIGTHPTDTETAAAELELGLSPVTGPALTTCPVTDQVPSIAGQQQLITVNDPSQQALKANQAVFSSGTTTAASGAFADMNWGESRYYGMSVASLQNAAGAFVAPTVASLDAALTDATVNPDGSYTPKNLASDPAAYPMPSVIYAVVPTAPLASSDAAAVTELLTQLLDLTGGKASGNLPQGFVPLPASIDATATADVAKDVTSITPAPTTTSTTAPGGSSDSSGSNDSSDGGDNGDGSDLGPLIPPAGVFGTMANLITAADGLVAPAVTAGAHQLGRALLGPALPGYALVASHGRVLVPEAMGVGIVAVVVGAALMGSGLLRRRRARRLGAAAGAELGPEPEEEPT
jgi:hypothetical protein